MRRWYTSKSYKLMKQVRLLTLIILSPIWTPLYLLVFIGLWMENLLDYMDDKLDKLLDKFIPQIK